MATITIDALPDQNPIKSTDVLPLDDTTQVDPAQITRKAAVSTIMDYVNANAQLGSSSQVTGFNSSVNTVISSNKGIANGLATLNASLQLVQALQPSGVTAGTVGDYNTAVVVTIASDGRITSKSTATINDSGTTSFTSNGQMPDASNRYILATANNPGLKLSLATNTAPGRDFIVTNIGTNSFDLYGLDTTTFIATIATGEYWYVPVLDSNGTLLYPAFPLYTGSSSGNCGPINRLGASTQKVGKYVQLAANTFTPMSTNMGDKIFPLTSSALTITCNHTLDPNIVDGFYFDIVQNMAHTISIVGGGGDFFFGTTLIPAITGNSVINTYRVYYRSTPSPVWYITALPLYTDNNLSDLGNAATARTNLSLNVGAQTSSVSADLNLTNPMNTALFVSVSTSGLKVKLPAMNASNSILAGRTIIIANESISLQPFDIVANDGTTVIVSALAAGKYAVLQVRSNSTANGSFYANVYGSIISQNSNAVVLTGGNIDGTVIGNSSAVAGSFTTVSANQGKIYLPTNSQTGTTYTLAASDFGQEVKLSNASAITLTLPQQSTVTLAQGYSTIVANVGTSTATIVSQGTDTIIGNTTLAAGSICQIILETLSGGINTWRVVGGTSTLSLCVPYNYSSVGVNTYDAYTVSVPCTAINILNLKLTAGSGTLTIQKNSAGTLTTVTSGVAVSVTAQNVALTTNNTFVRGDILQYKWTAASSAVNLSSSIEFSVQQ